MSSTGSLVARSAAMVAVAALLAMGFIVTRPALPAMPGGGQVGSSSEGVASTELLRVYRIRTGLPPELVKGELRAVDELVFTYENVAGKKWLLIYGVDEHGHVYWFHPRGTGTDAGLAAVPALAGVGPHELTEPVSNALDGKKLTLHGVFSDERLTVKRVESLLRGRGPDEPLSLPGAITTLHSVKVTKSRPCP